MNPGRRAEQIRIDCLEIQYFQRKQFFADSETYHYVKIKLSACGKIQVKSYFLSEAIELTFSRFADKHRKNS